MYYLMYCGISSNLLLYCNAAILINRPIRVAVLTHARPFHQLEERRNSFTCRLQFNTNNGYPFMMYGGPELML